MMGLITLDEMSEADKIFEREHDVVEKPEVFSDRFLVEKATKSGLKFWVAYERQPRGKNKFRKKEVVFTEK